MLLLAIIRLCIIVTEAFCQNTNAHFFENIFHTESEKEDAFFNALIVITYQAKILILVGILLHFMKARGHICD